MGYYDVISSGYDELHKEEQLKKVKLLIKLLKIKNDKVLDVGCGTAFYSNLFKDYIGLDNSKDMLSKSKAKVFYGKAEALPFEDQSFDTVISITAIHNFRNPKKAIQEMKRVSKNKIGITLLKKSKRFKEISNLLNDFDKVEEDKDIIFYKIFKT